MYPDRRLRSRSRGALLYPKADYFSYNAPGGVKVDSWRTGKIESIWDYSVKDFFKRSQAGEVIMSPYTKQTSERTSSWISRGNGYIGGPSQWWEYRGITPDTAWCLGLPGNDISMLVGLPMLHAGSIWEQLNIEAATKCLSNIGRASTDSWENLAEVRKTLNMFWSPLSSWYVFERKAFTGTAKEQSAANAWLMYRYGLKPLISSINDILDALKKSARPKRKTSHGEVQSVLSSASIVTINNASVFTVRKTITERVLARATSVDDVVWDLSMDLGFSAKSLLTLPWELVSYSFVVDWFVNVGDFLGAVVEAFHLRNLGQCIAYQIEQTAEAKTLTHTGSGNVYVITPCLAAARDYRAAKMREVGPLQPGFVLKTDFHLGDLTRLVDALALVGQQVLRRFGQKP